jgi:hypothetical protein
LLVVYPSPVFNSGFPSFKRGIREKRRGEERQGEDGRRTGKKMNINARVGAAAGGGVKIPPSAMEVVRSLKEIVENSDDEIYAMLKECNMDLNETAQRLLNQGIIIIIIILIVIAYLVLLLHQPRFVMLSLCAAACLTSSFVKVTSFPGIRFLIYTCRQQLHIISMLSMFSADSLTAL